MITDSDVALAARVEYQEFHWLTSACSRRRHTDQRAAAADANVSRQITCVGVAEDSLGGSALLIRGTPSADLLTPRAAARSLADRLLGRHPVSGPTETPIGRDRVLFESPCDALRPLADDFRTYVERAFDDPWPSTMCVRDYLAMDVVTIYLRGERSGNEVPSWYIQLTFSACAGMADTSAEVAAHWAEIWYREARDELASKYFLPFGFTPERVETTGPAKRFVPLGRLGYALFHGDEEAGPADSKGRSFELDWSVLETLSEVDLTREWQELDEALSDVRPAGVCLCQFCAPGQDLSRFEQLSSRIASSVSSGR